MTTTAGTAHTAFEFPYMVSDNQLRTSALLNFIFGAVCLLVFISMRGTIRSVGGLYQRRRELPDLFLQPPQLLMGGLQQAWSWASAVMCMSDADIVRTAGFDALLLNRTIVMGLQIFSVLTLLSFCILLPTYYSFDDIVTHRLHRGTNVAELSRTTISNLPPGHAILWLPTLATYLVTAYCCWVLLVHCQSYAELRMAYMLCLDAAGSQPYQDRKPRRRSSRSKTGGSGTWSSRVWGAGAVAGHALELSASGPFASGGGAMAAGSTHGSAASLQQLLSTLDPARNRSLGGQVGLHPQPGAAGRQPAHHAQEPLGPIPPLPPLHPLQSLHPLHHHPPHAHGQQHDPHGPTVDGGLRPSLSTASLQAAASAGVPVAVSVGPAQRVAGLARMSYDPAAGTMTSMPSGGVSEPGTPAAPHGAGSLPLRARLRLVAPWLRHVVISAAERAAGHNAVDNLLACVNPLKMLAKDREDWARQQIAADDNLDPSLPPVPSGHPPAATAVHAGLLVASEDMIMALTGRAGDVTDPSAGGRGLGGRIEWSDSVADLAKSLGTLLDRNEPEGGGRAGGKAVAGRPGSGGAGEVARGSQGGSPLALSSRSGSGSEADGEGQGSSGRVADRDGGMEGRLGQSGAVRHSSAAGATGLKGGGGGGLGTDGGVSSKAPAVYRYWAPEAEQRCFSRALRRRQRRAAAAAVEPFTPLGFDSVLNPIFELSAAAMLAAASGGGSFTDGGMAGAAQRRAGQRAGRQSASSNLVSEGRRRELDDDPTARTDSGDAASTYDGRCVPSGSGAKSIRGAGCSVPSSSGGGGGVARSSFIPGPGLQGRVAAASSGGGGVGGGRRSGATSAAAEERSSGGAARGVAATQPRPGEWAGVPWGEGNVDNSEDDGERPWAGWQQQPLVAGRCNARLRQLMKVRYGGRNHLVNCHHYAVLVRDVVLHPVERFNAIGLPVVRSSVETTHDLCDIEWGGVAALQAAAAAAVAAAGAATAAAASGARVLGSTPPSGEAVGRGKGERSGGMSSAGGSASASGGGVGGPVLLSDAEGTGEPSDGASAGGGSGDEHNPLLPAGVDGSYGPPQRRRRRPLLHPTSELPLRDRAVHLVRDLRQQRGWEQGQVRSPLGASSAPRQPGAGAVAAGSADVGGAAGARPTGAKSAVEMASAVARRWEVGAQEAGRVEGEEGPLLGPFGSSSGHRVDAAAAAATSAGGHSSDVSRQQQEAHPSAGPPAAAGALDGHGPDGQLAAALLQAAAAARAATAAAAALSGSCSGPVPSPPPCMETPYDDSEEAAAVAAYYAQLFPESFQRLVPVCNHRVVDELLFQWTSAMGQLAAALLAAHVHMRTDAANTSHAVTVATASAAKRRSGAFSSPSSTPAVAQATAAASLPSGQPLPPLPDLPPPGSAYTVAVRRAAVVVRQLQDRIAVERARALRSPTRLAYIALFSSQRDAAAAAQCSPLAPPSRAQPLHFRACAAPPPDSVYWPALWTLPTGRAARVLMSAPLLAVLVFPIGVLTGALANLPVAVCGGTPELNRLYWPWFCSSHHGHTVYTRVAKSLLTGVLPALISLSWNAWVLPMVLYMLSAIQSRCVSLPAMDRQMSRWFFWWSLLNMFLGAVVGGGIFQQLGAYLQDPGKLLLRIGTALPTASNFFMHYTLTKGLYSNWLRVAWPHLGCMAGAILRGVGGAALPRSWQDVFLIHSPPGYRFSSFYNGVFQTLMVGLAYVVTAPLIAPIALLFFATAYITWRYAIVYVYERQYESGGHMFPVVFDHMTGYLLVAEVFTGAVLLTNGAWIQAALLWCSLTPAIVAFRRLCVRRYLWPLEHPPLSLAMAAPPASVDAAVYLPPALREGSIGWYPESGKVWEQYNIPKYVI